MFSFLKRFLNLKTVLNTAVIVASVKVGEKLDEKGLDEVERAVADAILSDFVEEVNKEIDKL